jgi:hypothetical protein
MAHIDEQIRRIRNEVGSPDLQRQLIAELHRREAVQAVGKVVVADTKPAKTWQDALLETAAGRTMIQVKLDAEARAKASIEIADRIRQLKELVHDVFVIQPKVAESVNGWRPRVRFDIYQASKESCRKLGQVGGVEYERVITAVKYALTSSKDYRSAIEALGL